MPQETVHEPDGMRDAPEYPALRRGWTVAAIAATLLSAVVVGVGLNGAYTFFGAATHGLALFNAAVALGASIFMVDASKEGASRAQALMVWFSFAATGVFVAAFALALAVPDLSHPYFFSALTLSLAATCTAASGFATVRSAKRGAARRWQRNVLTALGVLVIVFGLLAVPMWWLTFGGTKRGDAGAVRRADPCRPAC